MERFVALLLLVSGIPEGLEARSFKRLTETISVENGTLTRGVIEDGPFGGNGGGGWTDGGEVHLNGHPSALDVRTGSRLDALRIRYGDINRYLYMGQIKLDSLRIWHGDINRYLYIGWILNWILSVSGMEMYKFIDIFLSRTGSRLDALRIRYGDINKYLYIGRILNWILSVSGMEI
ncbi:uncharacterized protein LOC111702105 isoform X2 [Eurytemora carolleeae]|uniref:uncharacterized protein LOC111702105 isoform X2 n=1 Tax=Eurytemora carolleeae TaxID=1294199 RepID=UPI000C770833|nr:uncharacterized protein LOC111702105 isoform X2 [Eurytemora carolleeae]|eukprot:XP_023329446.1 uncharacterized protein LOC111702105 isoform X2 [Eurytemora affinis]